MSVSVPIGAGTYGGSISASKSNINSHYASVNELAGIKAGDGGFQVSTSGNTNLTGAVIASTQTAIDNNKNSLTTKTLTTSDIQNQADYSGKAVSVSIGGGTQSGKPTLTGAGYGEDSGKANSVTVSSISQGTVIINDDSKQQDLTGKDATTTVALLNRDVHVDANGNAVDSQGNSTAHTIAPIFDQEKVAREIQAQVEITKAFNQEAPKALASFAASKTQPYQDSKDYEHIKSRQADGQELSEYERGRLASLEASGMTTEKSQTILNDPQAKADYENWNGNGDYLRAANIIVAAIGGGTTGAATAVTKESLSWAADQMRQKMIEDSEKFKGLCTSPTDCITNTSGDSVGVNGDNTKVAGGRIVIENWCKAGGATACQIDYSTKSGYAENSDGTVIFQPKDAQGNNLTISQFIDQNPEMRSPLGGHQGEEGQMKLLGIQFNYDAGSTWDRLAESFAGTHDTLNSFIWYDQLGNGKNLDGTFLGTVGNATNMTNVPLASPFALSVILPPEIWNAIVTLILSNH